MRRMKTSEEYADKCLEAERGDVMAKLEVNAERVRIFATDLDVFIAELAAEDDSQVWTDTLAASRLLRMYVEESTIYSDKPVTPLDLCGMIANKLHDAKGRMGEGNFENACEIWEKLAHVQYLFGTLYPTYTAVVSEAVRMERAGLTEYSDAMIEEAKAIVDSPAGQWGER